jgi:hypothetical protein
LNVEDGTHDEECFQRPSHSAGTLCKAAQLTSGDLPTDSPPAGIKTFHEIHSGCTNEWVKHQTAYPDPVEYCKNLCSRTHDCNHFWSYRTN